jgi:hypothetical protein
MVKKVISGGQSGADRIGLEIARELGIETGGTAPKNYKTENGCDLSLKEFGLVEDESSDYNPRTEKNVINSDGTVIFGDIKSPGSKVTISFLKTHNKKYIINPTADELKNFINENNIQILNVAGNRGSKLNLAQVHTIKTTLIEGLKKK